MYIPSGSDVSPISDHGIQLGVSSEGARAEELERGGLVLNLCNRTIDVYRYSGGYSGRSIPIEDCVMSAESAARLKAIKLQVERLAQPRWWW